MSIRSLKNLKDHSDKNPHIQEENYEFDHDNNDGYLKFWTNSPDGEMFIDLERFATGQNIDDSVEFSRKLKKQGFTGRRELIEEMFPIIREHIIHMRRKSADKVYMTMRAWWRIFDDYEKDNPSAKKIISTSQLELIHCIYAKNKKVGRIEFNNFHLLAEKTRIKNGFPLLHWIKYDTKEVKRVLHSEQIHNEIRNIIKHEWFKTLDRWSRFEELALNDAPPETHSEHYLKENYKYFLQEIKKTKNKKPNISIKSHPDLYKKFPFNPQEAMEGIYPNSSDIRTAFLLCLSNTGWNPATLLDMDINNEFIKEHPKDPGRYILKSFKARSATEQFVEGLYKTQSSTGFIILKLLEKNLALRNILKQRLELAENSLNKYNYLSTNKKISELKQEVSSPWIFFSLIGDGIHCLDKFNNKLSEHLRSLIDEYNLKTGNNLPYIVPSDFRDHYAYQIYTKTNGSVFSVMKSLGHKSLSSTNAYISNSIIDKENRELFKTFSTALWSEIKQNNTIDPSILAKISRDGNITNNERERIKGYREILKSRIEVGCKDPTNPPPHLSVEKNNGGLCHVQRCLLCKEHAIIFPESIDGICKRYAELLYIKKNMSITAYLQSRFDEELNNAESIFNFFDKALINEKISFWENKIKNREHFVIDFNGKADN